MKLTKQDVNSIAKGRAQAEIRKGKPSNRKRVYFIGGICIGAVLMLLVSFAGGVLLLVLLLGIPLFLDNRRFREKAASIHSELQNDWKEYIEE